MLPIPEDAGTNMFLRLRRKPEQKEDSRKLRFGKAKIPSVQHYEFFSATMAQSAPKDGHNFTNGRIRARFQARRESST